MTTQPPDPPAGTAVPAGQWPGPPGEDPWLDPDWASSQDLWPAPGPQPAVAAQGEPGQPADGYRDGYQPPGYPPGAGHDGVPWPRGTDWQSPGWADGDPWLPQGQYAAPGAPGQQQAPWQPGEPWQEQPSRQEEPWLQDTPWPPGYPDEPAAPSAWPAGAWGTGDPWANGEAPSQPAAPYAARHGAQPEPLFAAPLAAQPEALPILPPDAQFAAPFTAQPGVQPEPQFAAPFTTQPGTLPAAQPQVRFPPQPAADDGLRWVVAGYLTVPFFSFLVPLAVYGASLRRPHIRAHAAQAANIAFTVLMYEISAAIMGGMLALDSPLVALVVTGLLLTVLWLTSLAYLVRSAGAAGRGRPFPVPRWLCATLLR